MHIFPTLIINFNLLSMIVNLWWSSLCGEIGSKEMLSAWLPGGNWMLKVTAQDVHILCKYFHRMLPSCSYKYLCEERKLPKQEKGNRKLINFDFWFFPKIFLFFIFFVVKNYKISDFVDSCCSNTSHYYTFIFSLHERERFGV